MKPHREEEAANERVAPTRYQYAPQALREDIRAAELAVAVIGSQTTATQVLALFSLLDRINNAFQGLSQAGADLRPEAARLATIHGRLTENSQVTVRALYSLGGLPSLRAVHKPPSDRWWWYLDRQMAAQIKEKRLKRIRYLGILALLLVIVGTAYSAFLRPSRITRQKHDLVFDAESDVENGDYASALARYQKAQALDPSDAEISLMIGLMYEALNQSGEAERQYAVAMGLYEGQAAFSSVRSQKYGLLGWYDKSLTDALDAVRLDDQFAAGYCVLANAYEGLAQYNLAITALHTCADLAFEQGQDELYVIAKARLAALLQMPN